MTSRYARIVTSDSVTEGHPDKLCDQVSDAVLDAHLAEDPAARVACEVLAAGNWIGVFGEVTSRADVDVEGIVRLVARDVGYTDLRFGLDASTCRPREHLRVLGAVQLPMLMCMHDQADDRGAGRTTPCPGQACTR
jgi:S-adenosylmethionine synthetase